MSDHCDCKVGRVADAYDLPALDDELLQRRAERDASLRDLTEYTNTRVLEAAILDASSSELDVENQILGAFERDDAVAAVYEVLTGDDVSPDRRARVRTRLEQAGVDLDAVESDWVTHPTVKRHLNECLDVDTSRRQSVDAKGAKTTVGWIRSRCQKIVARTFERARDGGVVETGDLETTVVVQVTCRECGATYSPDDLLNRGQCDCPDTASEQPTREESDA